MKGFSKKKIMIIPILFLAVFFIFIVLVMNGTIKFATLGKKEIERMAETVEKLADEHFYIWHNSTTDDITADLNNVSTSYVFTLCPSGDTNINKNSYARHTIWFTSDNDSEIPTLYSGDKLLYVSSDSIPYEGMEWERYADYGYSIGVANLESDNSGHCYIYNSGKGFRDYVYSGSDANQVNMFSDESMLFLDKVGNNSVGSSSITDGGTIKGLTKDKTYLCEFYTGTYYQDFSMTANVHTFSVMEEFTTYDYKFLHSNCIEITIPGWFKTGYYYINGMGLFRYVTSLDQAIYNGQPYDEAVNWNDPIKQYDSNGSLIYDPSEGIDKRGTSTSGSISSTTTGAASSSTKRTSSASKNNVSSSKGTTDKSEGDVGVSAYENIYNEVKVK